MPKKNAISPSLFSLQKQGFTLTSLISQKISETDEALVQKLIELGGKEEEIIYGLAYSGKSGLVKLHIDKCSMPKKDALIGQAIKGYARAGNFQAIYNFSNYREHLNKIVLGCAQAGNKEKLNPILANDLSLFEFAVEGFADGEHTDLLSNLIIGTRFYPQAIFYAARAGNIALTTDLLKACNVDFNSIFVCQKYSTNTLNNQAQINKFSLINQAVKGLATGGHFKDAAAALDRGASIVQCIAGLQDTFGYNNPAPILILLKHVKNSQVKDKLNDQVTQISQDTTTEKTHEPELYDSSTITIEALVKKAEELMHVSSKMAGSISP